MCGRRPSTRDVASFFTKWLDDVEEAQRSFGAYPDYAPYPMAHGEPRKTFGTAWMDAGIICPWTIYQVYGDRRMIERHYESMGRFMEFRMAASPGLWGCRSGTRGATGWRWGNHAGRVCRCLLLRLHGEPDGRDGGRDRARGGRGELPGTVRGDSKAFAKQYLVADGRLTVDTQTAYALALFVGLLPEVSEGPAAARLAEKIDANGGRMATGFLGTRPLLPVLSAHGHHDLALRLLQSREFPSWGYEIVNGATTVWERWDSYTKEDAFGRHNAAMNSFSHYAFGAVCEWLFQGLAGIDTDGPGYRKIWIRPGPPHARGPSGSRCWTGCGRSMTRSGAGSGASGGRATGLNWRCRFRRTRRRPCLLPARNPDQVRVDGAAVGSVPEVRWLGVRGDCAAFEAVRGSTVSR